MDITTYKFPEELEPYRNLIGYVGDNERIEDIVNHYYNNPSVSEPVMITASAVLAQINLLKTLHRNRMLRDLSAWVCKTPYPETSKFCGKPGEHPDFWGCGYERVD